MLLRASAVCRNPKSPRKAARPWGLETGRPGEIDRKAGSVALVAAGHFRCGVAKVLLHVTFVRSGMGGKARTQGMP
jgi:hypothetical protein